jgi:hypothetical protein
VAKTVPFKTLQKAFRFRDKKVAVDGEIIRDADLRDKKFGGKERFGIDQGLNGWAKQATPTAGFSHAPFRLSKDCTIRS